MEAGLSIASHSPEGSLSFGAFLGSRDRAPPLEWRSLGSPPLWHVVPSRQAAGLVASTAHGARHGRCADPTESARVAAQAPELGGWSLWVMLPVWEGGASGSYPASSRVFRDPDLCNRGPREVERARQAWGLC